MTTSTTPGEAFLAMIGKTDRDLIAVASRSENGPDEIMARDILRGRMTSTWRR